MAGIGDASAVAFAEAVDALVAAAHVLADRTTPGLAKQVAAIDRPLVHGDAAVVHHLGDAAVVDRGGITAAALAGGFACLGSSQLAENGSTKNGNLTAPAIGIWDADATTSGRLGGRCIFIRMNTFVDLIPNRFSCQGSKPFLDERSNGGANSKGCQHTCPSRCHGTSSACHNPR